MWHDLDNAAVTPLSLALPPVHQVFRIDHACAGQRLSPVAVCFPGRISGGCCAGESLGLSRSASRQEGRRTLVGVAHTVGGLFGLYYA